MRRLILLVVGLAAALVLVPTTAVADSTTGTTLTHWCPSPHPQTPKSTPPMMVGTLPETPSTGRSRWTSGTVERPRNLHE
jgi:hypothetical protein